MRKPLLVAVAVAVASLLAPSRARAQSPTEPCHADGPPRDGYAYCFVDDAMRAGGLGELPLILHASPGPARQALLRPRLEFVQELLKSVENL